MLVNINVADSQEFIALEERFLNKIRELEDRIKRLEADNNAGDDKWLNVEESCEYLSVSRQTLYSLRKDTGVVTHYTSSGRPRFKKSDLDKIFNAK